ncbi:MAG: hypothetical protein U0230_13525 [Polyangiales bacterium]
MSRSSVLASSLVLALGLGGCAAGATNVASTTGTRGDAHARCSSLSLEERSSPVLAGSADIAGTREIHELVGKQRRQVLRGMAVYVPARPGTSAPYVERLARCEAASHQGGAADTGTPLAVSGVQVDVRNSGPAYEIRLTSRDPEAAREIERRVEALVAQR